MLKLILFTIILTGLYFWFQFQTPGQINQNPTGPVAQIISENIPKILPSPLPSPIIIPASYEIPLKTHVFQTYNNCGPAALSMALSYYGITKTQAQLGQELRPFQVAGGNNDDKSVTLEEVAEKSKEYGLIPYLRPNGSIDLMKKFIANDIPVIVRTWLKPNDDIGHYRIIRGYTPTTIIQDDSFQNKNLSYTNQEFDEIWDKFNYEYLVLVPPEKQILAQQILGEDLDEKIAWQKAVGLSKEKLAQNPNDITAGFNLSVAYYKLGEYQKSVEEFEKVESRLPFRTLWYQIEPILSYYELGEYARVIEISDKVLNYHNRAFSELYYLKGLIVQKQGREQEAQELFNQADFYNTSESYLVNVQ